MTAFRYIPGDLVMWTLRDGKSYGDIGVIVAVDANTQDVTIYWPDEHGASDFCVSDEFFVRMT